MSTFFLFWWLKIEYRGVFDYFPSPIYRGLFKDLFITNTLQHAYDNDDLTLGDKKNLCLSCVNFHRYTLSNVKGDLKRKILKKTKTIDTSKVHCEVHRGIIHIAVIQRRVKLICKIGKSISKWNKTKIIFTIFKFKNTVSHLIADIEIKTSEKKENMERNGGKLFEAPSRRPSPLLLSTSLGAPCVLLPIIPIFEPIFLQRIYWYQSSKRC